MSQFQLFPIEIVERVVKYSVNTYASTYRTDTRAVLSLLHSCHSWRKAFISVAFDSLALMSSKKDIIRVRFSKCCEWINPLEYPLDRLVKSLKITFHTWADVLSGKVDAWMQSSRLAELRFTRLDSFVFNVWNPPPTYLPGGAHINEALQKIVSFFKLFHQMMPSMRNIVLEKAAVGWPVNDIAVGLLVENQILDLLRNVSSAKFGCYGVSAYLQHADVFSNDNLTSLSYTHCYDSDSASFLRVVRLNAANIVSVDMDRLPLNFVKSLITHDNNEPVVYPRLRVLRLTSIYRASAMWPPSSEELADSSSETNHFPALKNLDFSDGFYPFKHNVLGSGLNSTLEDLKFTFGGFDISKDLVQALLSTQFVKLKSVALVSRNYRYSHPSRIVVDIQQEYGIADFLQSFLQSSACLTKLSSINPIRSSLFLEDNSCPAFDSLRFLDVVHNRFDFSDVLQIIQKAPYLNRLSCRLDDNLPKLDGIGPTKLPEHIQEFSPINSHFFELRVKWPSRKVVKNHIKSAVLLAIGCPNFSTIVFEQQDGDDIRSQIENLLKTRTYKNYADAGKKLINMIEYSYIVEPVEDSRLFE